jgi:hypothetical protein
MLLIPVLNPPKKPGKRRNKVATKKKTEKRSSTVRTTTRKKGKLTWTEAARASGAVYPAKYPKWHDKAGEKTGSKKGMPMSKWEALQWKRPVVGYISAKMVKDWYDPKTGGATARKRSKRMTKATEAWAAAEKKMAEFRKKSGTPWKRHTEYYKRDVKNKAGKVIHKKGSRKKDYKVLFGKVKFRSGRGPTRTIKVRRGFSPSQSQIDRLIRGGFAGHTSAPGGKVKLNKPRRRKKAKRRRSVKKNPRRRKKAKRKNPRRRKKAKKNPRRRKAKARKNPRRKRRKTTGRRTKRRTRKRKRAYSYKANPKRRRKRKTKRKAKATRKNPHRKRRRKRRRTRRNPGLKLPGILQGMISDLQSAPKWITAGHILIGAGANATLCGWALTRGPLARVQFLQQRGFLGSAARLLLCGLGAGAISAVGAFAAKQLKNPMLLRGARTNLLIGGMAYALANFLYEVAPGTAGMLMIPQVGAPARRGLPAGTAGLGLGYGSSGPDYRYGAGGLGSVISPEDLVAGESLARNVNEFSGMGDWMELSGLGSSGGAPIPMEDLRGYPGQYGKGQVSGMGDWVELTSNNALVQAGFDPGVEAF